MNLKEGLLLLGVLIALLCIPAAVAAAGGGGPDEPYYIEVVLDEPKGYLNLNITTIDVLDPLDIGNTSVALQSTETGDLKAIEYPLLGSITREFNPTSGPYQGATVTVTENKTVDGSTFPREYGVYTTPTIPSFTVNVPDRWGNVLLIKCPENLDKDANFTELFHTANKEGYLFAGSGILHFRIKGTNPAGFNNPFDLPADQNSLSNTLNGNRVDLTNFNFRPDELNADDLYYIPQPKAGAYLLTAVEYDSASETMHVLAAMPVLILDGDTPVTWAGDNPHFQDKDVTISFGEGVNVDKIAYALVKNDTTYGLQVNINTTELANQPFPTSAADVITILKSIAGRGLLAEYTLTCDANTPNITYNKDSCIAIVEGYGCSGANAASSVDIAAGTLATLNPGTYYLYALGMQGQNVTAIDQTEVTIIAPPTGSIEVTSVPTNATIYLDGAETGKFTNTTLSDVTAGEHTVTLTLDGYSNATQSVTVVAGETAPLHFDLEAEVVEPTTGNLTVTSVPEGATLWLDDVNTGEVTNATLTDIDAGEHTVTLMLDGYLNATQSVTVVAGETVTLHFDLEAPVIPAPVASFTADPMTGEAPLTVAFNDTSTGATAWSWDFENDGVIDSTEQHPVHTYETAGTYTVNLTVMNAGGNNSTTKTIMVTEVPVTTGSIEVTSVPTNASIWLDGAETGKFTNTTLSDVTAGEHTVTLTLDGYEDATQSVTVVAGETATLHFDLVEEVIEPTTGSIEVTSVPTNATIYLDGAETGKFTNTTLSDVTAGEHTVTLTLDGYEDATQSVTVVAGETATLHFDLVEEVIEPTTGSIEVTSVPTNASIWLDGAETGKFTNTTLTDVDAGDHIVTLKLDGYEDATQSVTVVAGETATLHFDLVEEVIEPTTGSIEVTSVPTNATIYLDGAETGKFTNTTLSDVTAGEHTVTLTLDGYSNATQSVTVVAGETAPLHFDLVKVIEPPVASFTADPMTGEAPLTVEFCDTSTNNPTSWSWDFENDGVIDSTEQHPVHTYETAGTYTVNLTVTNTGGSDSTTKTITVQDIQPETPLVEENFTLGSDAINVRTEDGRQQVTFNATTGTGEIGDDNNNIHLQSGGLAVTIRTDGLTTTDNVSTGTVTGVQLESVPISTSVSSAGKISVSFTAEMNGYNPNLGITTSIYEQPNADAKEKFGLAAENDGRKLGDIAYAVYFIKTNLTGDDNIQNATLRLTASQEWVNKNRGPENIQIFRLADDGTCEMLKTTYAGPDENDMMTFIAESPDGFSSFVLAAVTDSEPPVTPTPTQTSRRSSGGGGGGSSTSVGAASSLQSGDRVALTMDRTAISAVTFTANTQIKDVMVTMAKGSLPRAAEPPAATVYQYIEATLYRAAEDDLSNIWFRFAVPTDWLAAQGCTADGVALFRLTDDGWQAVPVEVLSDGTGDAIFTASPDGFGLFAIAVTEKVPGVDEPTPEPTGTETTPTADVTTPPADKPTTEPTPTPGFGALVALAGLGAGAILVLRRE